MAEQLSRAVAEVIRRLCEERGITKRALAEKTGINLRSIERKAGMTSPFDLDDLELIAPVLGVTAAEIVDWAERA